MDMKKDWKKSHQIIIAIFVIGVAFIPPILKWSKNTAYIYYVVYILILIFTIYYVFYLPNKKPKEEPTKRAVGIKEAQILFRETLVRPPYAYTLKRINAFKDSTNNPLFPIYIFKGEDIDTSEVIYGFVDSSDKEMAIIEPRFFTGNDDVDYPIVKRFVEDFSGIHPLKKEIETTLEEEGRIKTYKVSEPIIEKEKQEEEKVSLSK